MRFVKSYTNRQRNKTRNGEIKFSTSDHTFDSTIYAFANDPKDKRFAVGGKRRLNKESGGMVEGKQ